VVYHRPKHLVTVIFAVYEVTLELLIAKLYRECCI
jgi:hypothetical protein